MANLKILRPIGLFLELGAIGAVLNWALNIIIYIGTIYVWFVGVSYGFNHSFIAGIVSIIPPVGFIEGLLHLLRLI